MASPAHCFYCFEVLAASYESQSHPTLESVLYLYGQWQKHVKGEEVNNESPDQGEPIAQNTDQIEERHNRDHGQLQLPSISRLRDLSPSTTQSQSSSVSTPSSRSVNSSNTQLTSITSTSISTSSIAPTPTYVSRLSVTESYPLFVTWNTLRGSHKSLRGCIGTFEPLPLEKGLESYALTSAYEDTRFSPIPQQHVPSLSCSLTLLADFEECEDAMDWELGKHGIRISFTHRYRRHGATYLPDVAVEQGWTKEETLESLMRKAGWEGQRRFRGPAPRPWEDVKDFRVVRYTGLKASAAYAEWQQWQQWARTRQPELWTGEDADESAR